jgi:hypothetical protein
MAHLRSLRTQTLSHLLRTSASCDSLKHERKPSQLQVLSRINLGQATTRSSEKLFGEIRIVSLKETMTRINKDTLVRRLRKCVLIVHEYLAFRLLHLLFLRIR